VSIQWITLITFCSIAGSERLRMRIVTSTDAMSPTFIYLKEFVKENKTLDRRKYQKTFWVGPAEIFHWKTGLKFRWKFEKLVSEVFLTQPMLVTLCLAFVFLLQGLYSGQSGYALPFSFSCDNKLMLCSSFVNICPDKTFTLEEVRSITCHSLRVQPMTFAV